MIEEKNSIQDHEVIKMLKNKKLLNEQDVTTKLDVLSSNLSKDLDAISVWDEMKYVDIQPHINQIMQYSNSYKTKILSLSVLKSQIKLNWINLSNEDVTENTKQITQMLELEIQRYKGELDQEKEDIIKAFSAVLLEIAKLGNQLHNFMPQMLRKSLENQIFCESFMKFLVYLIEDMESKEQLIQQPADFLTQEIFNLKESILHLAFYVLDKYAENKDQVKKDLCQTALEIIYYYCTLTKSAFSTERCNFFLGLLKEPVFRDLVLNCLEVFFKEPSNVKKYSILEEIIKEIQNQIPFDIDVLREQSIIQKEHPDQEQNFLKMCVSANQMLLAYAINAVTIPALNIVDYFNSDKQFRNIFGSYLNYIEKFTPVECLQLQNIDFWIQFLGQIKDTTYDKSEILAYFNETLIDLAYHLISYFSRPDSCRIEINEKGEASAEFQISNDETLYNQKRTLLHLIINLKYDQFHEICIQKFEKMIDGSEWNLVNIESFQYALGAVIGGLDPVKEKQFCISTIKSYLNLIETRRNKIAKTMLVNSLFYVTSKFEIFLKNHYNVLESLVQKIIDFIQDDSKCIQDVAVYYFNIFCEIFYVFFTTEMKNGEIKFKSLVNKSKFITKSLSLIGKSKFYNSLIFVVKKCDEREKQEALFNALIHPILKDAEKYIQDHEQILVRSNYLDIRLIFEILAEASCQLSDLFFLQMKFDDVSKIKTFLDSKIQQTQKKQKLDDETISLLVSLREPIVAIVGNCLQFLQKKDNMLTEQQESSAAELVQVAKNIIKEFQNLDDAYKDHTTIYVIQQCIQISKKEDDISQLTQIFFSSCERILSKEQNNPLYKNHIMKSYQLVKMLSKNYPLIIANQIINQINTNSLQLMNFIICGINNTETDIYLLSLESLNEIVQEMNKNNEKVKTFYQKHLYDVLKCVFQAAVDGYHNKGIKLIIEILTNVFSILQKIKPSQSQKNMNKKQKENIIASYILQKISEVIRQKEIIAFIENKKLIEDLLNSWDKDFKQVFMSFLDVVNCS
ncbi:CRM1 carboxy-terminal protein (macronuclear) [Tetrahymena thermophila SB210]|uniref:CRM1 carboxy-terminal protein n=1 Tax=Tetrahymena thermophila (strain SB210) TaxID=312017 RepID=Q23D96_TETTS|nr:CRM1 carboxy-terminal protein [Tetrahymena thermophila SB210]EAR94515.3 CRM1 carboxy-terminal protein [Tetrahymena thermophila SB210]|eukprot:XP_001014790.3 CRM1 carboxy-terminal protein [Tetrahymena thermophila SB210]